MSVADSTVSTVPWLGSGTPWPALAVKRLYDIRLGKMLQNDPEDADDALVPFLKASHVRWDGLVIDDLPEMWASPRDRLRFEIRRGDLLVNEGGEVGRAHIVDRPLVSRLIIQNSLHRVRSDVASVRYLAYVLRAMHDSAWLDAVCNKATIQHLTGEKLGELVIPVPPRDVQEECADILDVEVGRIDAIVRAKLRLLEVLEEKRFGQITELLTRGATTGASMAPTALIAELELPSHWSVVRLRRLVRRFIDYRGATPEKALSGVPLVTARNIRTGRIDLSLGEEFVAEADYEEWMRRGLPEIGDVLVTTEAPLGEVGQVTEPHIALAQRVILLRAHPNRVRPTYLKYYFMSAVGQGELWSRATGSTALGIKAERLRDVLVPVPPLTEQEAIAERLDDLCDAIDAASSLLRSQLVKLTEHRRAVIVGTISEKRSTSAAPSNVRAAAL
jgi:type I restriction enzyme S subunit